jgi:dipeptidyl aminopeptidase/acylaminoacyl peptidase
MKRFLTILFALSITFVFSQKKIIDPSVYNDWKKNEAQILSNNGQYVAYEINPHKGDGWLFLHQLSTGITDSFPRGKEAKFSFDGDYLTFKITPGFDTLRNCELQKVDKKKWPKDTLGIYILSSDSLLKIPMLKSFSVGEENNWMSYTLDENTLKSEKKAADKKEEKKKKKKKCCALSSRKNTKKGKEKAAEKPSYTSDGKVLTLLQPIVKKEYIYKDVTDYVLSENGKQLAFVEHKKEKSDSFQLQLVSMEDGKRTSILAKQQAIKSLVFDKSGQNLAFLASQDTTKVKVFSLNVYALNSSKNTLIDTTHLSIPKEDAVSENKEPRFTEDGRFLYFGVTERPKNEVKDTLLDSEKVRLDIWHYQDTRLQPQQLVELKRDLKKTDFYVLHLADGKVLKLADDTLNVRAVEKQIGNYLFASSTEKYKIESQWEVLNPEDHYRISLLDGTVELLKKRVAFDGTLSPNGSFYSYFDAQKSNYFLLDLNTKKETCITCSSTKINWQEDVNGMPMAAGPFGVKGYAKGENELYLLSQYDIWSYNIAQNKLSCITNKEGEQRKIRLNPLLWSNDSVYVDFANVYIEGFNEKTKGSHIFYIMDHGDHTDLVEKYYTDYKITFIKRSKNKETIAFRKMSLQEYPEIRITQNDFQTEKILSNTNPQQSEYNWAQVELVQWKSYDGIPLEGLLYKPENYDATKKYPLLVYFYELYSDDLHNHYAPKPTASVIYATEYASAGYMVFIPDIRYKAGYPAKSAYNCIMSGTDHVLNLFPAIDSTKMGLQGQSWGGYQTAQLITMTKRYAAAMAGAPVSNMFSAYGGIRWGSGMNRQFQYERTQSRIGKTIWEAPELYVANSPLFHVPNITTPLLIMHNDKDGSVPWYQGIELFTAMKRLGKPCWLLNYNGDDHNLMQNANRMDLSIRMRQYFDYYLQGKPAPKWLLEGIPAVDKGKEMGY